MRGNSTASKGPGDPTMDAPPLMRLSSKTSVRQPSQIDPEISDSIEYGDSMEKVELTEAQLDEKIIGFRGLTNELDDEMNKQIGKLLIDEADEEVNANSDAFRKLFHMMGGFKIIIFIAIIKLV
jgi:hypothetical protein